MIGLPLFVPYSMEISNVLIWRDIPVTIAFVSQLLFLLIFSIPKLGAGQWWRDFVGRALFIKTLSLTFLLFIFTLGVIYRATHEVDTGWIRYSTPLDPLINIGCWGIALASVLQLFTLVWTRRPKIIMVSVDSRGFVDIFRVRQR